MCLAAYNHPSNKEKLSSRTHLGPDVLGSIISASTGQRSASQLYAVSPRLTFFPVESDVMLVKGALEIAVRVGEAMTRAKNHPSVRVEWQKDMLSRSKFGADFLRLRSAFEKLSIAEFHTASQSPLMSFINGKLTQSCDATEVRSLPRPAERDRPEQVSCLATWSAPTGN